MNSKKGITLIALVITIIVLLILAGVSISAITGENGIVEKAKNAKDATRVAQIEEKIKLYQSENSMLAAGNETTKTMEEFVNELEKDGTITSEEKAGILEKHTLTIGNQEPIVFPFAKTLVQAFKDGEIKVGDYVEYTPSDLTATLELGDFETGSGLIIPQAYSVDTTVTWRVLGLNESGTELLITTGSPVRSDSECPYLELLGGAGIINGVDTLNDISYLYHNEELASETRSMTIEDINYLLGIVVDGNVVYKANDESKTNLDEDGCRGLTYTYISGDCAPENAFKNEYPDSGIEIKKIGDSVDITCYTYSYLDENVIDPDSVLYEILFKGTTWKEGFAAKSYYLANVGTYINTKAVETYCNFGLAGVYSGKVSLIGSSAIFGEDGVGMASRLAVRPIVSLKTDVTIEQVKLTTGSEEEWMSNWDEIGGSNEVSGVGGRIEE